jgi:hypothetical protein
MITPGGTLHRIGQWPAIRLWRTPMQVQIQPNQVGARRQRRHRVNRHARRVPTKGDRDGKPSI